MWGDEALGVCGGMFIWMWKIVCVVIVIICVLSGAFDSVRAVELLRVRWRAGMRDVVK